MSSIPSPGPGWKANTGSQPRNSRGKRIRAILNHGREATYDNGPMSPAGWSADKAGWALNPDYPFAIAWFLVL